MLALKSATISEPYIVGSVLVGADQAISEMVSERIPHCREHGLGDCTAFGIIRNGKVVGGVVFSSNRGFDVHMSAALACPLRPSEVRFLCDYAFGQLGVKRVTAITSKKNRKARKALRKLGFIQEGAARYALDGKQDAIQCGLLREHCKWINDHGLTVAASRS